MVATWTALLAALLLACCLLASEGIYSSPPLTPSQRQEVVRRLESRWARIQQRPAQLSSRELFSFALEWAEANESLERIDGALALAEQMQDRDPNSPTFGNFRWYWAAERVEDLNAVEFCMQDAALLWMRHRNRLPAEARERLVRLIQLGIEGILHHRVSVGYTNIYLMKTWNCIALGENFGRPDLAQQGYGMLTNWLLFTYHNGIREYLSPTYHGVSLDSLLLIARFSKNETARQQAEAALRLFWADISANWFEPCQRLGGAHSRDYDYLMGRGYLDEHLRFVGWLPAPTNYVPLRFAALASWLPPTGLREQAVKMVPRFVRQRWGAGDGEWAAHWVGRSVSIGVAGACYGPEDKVLTFQFAGGPNMPMGYFVMDAREDPYGKKREITPGGHQKSWHPEPFVASLQREREVILLAAIAPDDPSFRRRIPNPLCLRSHLVFPRNLELWVGNTVSPLTKQPGSTSVPKGIPVFLRHRDAVVGVRVLGAVTLEGAEAPIQLINDGNPYDVMTLSVTHSPQPPTHGRAWVAFWVRVAEGLDDAGFARFRQSFAQAKGVVTTDGNVVDVIAQGEKGKLMLRADIVQKRRLLRSGEEAVPQDYLLLVNGREVGKEILSNVEPIVTFRKLFTGRGVAVAQINQPFEVEKAPLIIPPFEVAEDAQASGGKFVWMPSPTGRVGGDPGARFFVPVRIPRSGRYYLWARVQTPTPDDDSFFISIHQQNRELLPRSEWHTGGHPQWTWVRAELGDPKSNRQSALELPAGIIVIEIACREDGAKIDCLVVTDRENWAP